MLRELPAQLLAAKLPFAETPLPTLHKKERAAPATPATLGLWVVQAIESPAAFPDPRIPLCQMMQRIV